MEMIFQEIAFSFDSELKFPDFCLNVHFQKISILPPQKGMEFPGRGGGGFCKIQKLKERCEALLKFTEGWGVLEKLPSVGEVWIFSGTTQW